MIDDDMGSTVLPTPQWLKELGQQIAAEYKLGTLDMMCITGMICTAIRKNTPKATTLWIARDKDIAADSGLYLFIKKPYELNDEGIWDSGYGAYQLPDDLFPEVTFENSPKRVELKILDDESEAPTQVAQKGK